MDDRARDASLEVVEEPKRRGRAADFLTRLVKEKPLGTVGAVLVLILLITGVFADLAYFGFPDVGLAPYGMNEIHLADRLDPPSAQYTLGTDNLGRDLFSRVIHGARISMYVCLGASTIHVLCSALIGLVTGYLGGKVDIIAQRFVDAWMCFPPLFLYLTVMALLGPGLIQVILVLGVASGIRSSRVIRSAVISIKENMYVEAARSIGCSVPRMILRHILPNVFPLIVISFTMIAGYMILSEATLSFLGFGIPPPYPSWGGMLSQAGRQYMYIAPWMVLWPGIALALTVYGLNMFGDAIRDLLDPRMRGGLGRYGRAKAIKVKK